MKILSSIVLSSLLALNISVHAAPMSTAPFQLQGGIVPHKTLLPGKLMIPLNSLPERMYFKVTCDIENKKYLNEYPVIIQFYLIGTWEGLPQTISPTNQYVLNHEITKFSMKFELNPMYQKEEIEILNFDDADDVVVKNCIASYVNRYNS